MQALITMMAMLIMIKIDMIHIMIMDMPIMMKIAMPTITNISKMVTMAAKLSCKLQGVDGPWKVSIGKQLRRISGRLRL